jgi:hypothetical protein
MTEPPMMYSELLGASPRHGHVLVRRRTQADIKRRFDVEHLRSVTEVEDSPDAVGRWVMRSRLNLVTGQPDARASVPVGGLDFEQPLLAVVWRKGSDVVTPMVSPRSAGQSIFLARSRRPA